MMLRLTHICLAAFCAVFGFGAQAEDQEVVSLHARFLDGPTEWCPADKGVPVIETMDGPNVEGYLPPERRHSVRVRRGANAQQDAKPDQDDGFFKSQSPVSTGRFYATVKICFSLYGSDGSGEWEIRDGSEIIYNGDFQSDDIWRAMIRRWRSPVPYFDYNRVHYFEPDDEVIFFAASYIETKRTTEAFASPAQEQSQ